MKTIFEITCKRGVAVIDTETGWIENYDALYFAVEDCFNYWLRKEATNAVVKMYAGCKAPQGEQNPCNWHGAVEVAIYAIANWCKKRQRDITSAAFLPEVRVASYLSNDPCSGCDKG